LQHYLENQIELLPAKAGSNSISVNNRPECYAFTAKKNYYQLVFSGNGHYSYNLVLMHYSRKGKLLSEITVASDFFDAGQGRLTKSVIKKDSLLVIGNLDLDERPEGVPCDSTAVIYRIEKNGTLRKLRQKTYKINCAYNFER